MHQLFELPELLRIIIESLERDDQVRCALTNHSWSEVALDVIWHEVDDLRLLLNALSPLKKKSQKKYVSKSVVPTVSSTHCADVTLLNTKLF
jgi:hypothetical protein